MSITVSPPMALVVAEGYLVVNAGYDNALGDSGIKAIIISDIINGISAYIILVASAINTVSQVAITVIPVPSVEVLDTHFGCFFHMTLIVSIKTTGNQTILCVNQDSMVRSIASLSCASPLIPVTVGLS